MGRKGKRRRRGEGLGGVREKRKRSRGRWWRGREEACKRVKSGEERGGEGSKGERGGELHSSQCR